MTPDTLTALLARGADDATALHAPGGRPLTYAALRGLMARTAAGLRAARVEHADRVAIVLPNGPEMAARFVAVAGAAAACPLNPAYRAEEFEFYLSDLKARALIVEQGQRLAGGRGRAPARACT